MKTIALVAVVLCTMFAMASITNSKREKARGEAEARAVFVRDSISAEHQRIQDSVRIAQREQNRLAREAVNARQQAIRDTVDRTMECVRENYRRRVEKIESVASRC